MRTSSLVKGRKHEGPISIHQSELIPHISVNVVRLKPDLFTLIFTDTAIYLQILDTVEPCQLC